uniref:Uncharacterized protein n=1 Tax=Tanacetum cinerariifolium TaxID=118510 RepID=A0A699JE33_TANCI|nr:hypothetical protein [Tanacetum cinerariifolium]
MHCTCASYVSRSLGESILAIGEDFASSDAILSFKSCCKLVGLANLASQVGCGSGQEGFLGKLLSGDEGVQQNQGDVKDTLGYKKKAVVVTSDPLALVAEKTNVSKRKEKVVVSLDYEGSGADDFSELKKITALLAKAFN